MQKSFILHIDSLSILSKMPDEIAGKFIKILYHYQLTGELLEMDFALEMAVTPFINQFQRDNNSYTKRCERNRSNGANGGAPKKQTQPIGSEKTHSVISEAKKPYNDNDSKNDSDSKNDNDSKNDSGNDFFSKNPQPEKIKDTAEFILTPPGDPNHQIFYEQEICMALQFTWDEVKLIYNAWLGDRMSEFFTLKEARQNFKGYASKWRMNSKNKASSTPTSHLVPIKREYSDLG